MKVEHQPFVERKRMTRLGEATARKLRSRGSPIVADRELFLIVNELYEDRAVPYLRGDTPSLGSFLRVRSLLRSEKVISRDEDYPRHWRVNTVPDLPAEDIVCIADPCTYVSHFSAIQRYGLTNRRATKLHLTQSDSAHWKAWLRENAEPVDTEKSVPIRAFRPRHPSNVRERPLSLLSTSDFGRFTQIKNSFSRISTIGQTFLDMLKNSELCGGMPHVVEIFDKFGATYANDIIHAIDATSIAIIKVRAGYLLEERLGIHNETVTAWRRWAQRGGSRRLDPHRPYSPRFSEDWMISLNA